MARERFFGVVFKIAETLPNPPLSTACRVLLQDRFEEFVSQYKTPDHPPYSAMIERALSELNDGRGSCEDSVSRYLQKSYNLLPLAHSALLKHHLSKLCESGDVVSLGKRYILPSQIATLNLCANVKRKPKRRKCRWTFERQIKSRRKVQMNKKRNRQDSKKVELVEKDCGSDDGEHQFIGVLHSVGKQVKEDRTKRSPSCDREENCVRDGHSFLRTKAQCLTAATEKANKGLSLQETGPSGVTDTDEGAAHVQEQHELGQTQYEWADPGFKSIRVENLSQMVSKALPSAKGLCGSMELVQPTGIEREQIPGQCSNMEVQQPAWQQQDLSFQQKQVRRSQPARHAMDEGEYSVGILQSQHCLEETPNTSCRQRHRLSKEKFSDQSGKDSSSQDRLESEKPPKFQSRKRPLKVKFIVSGVRSAAFVNDNSTQDLKQSRNHDGSTSLLSCGKAGKALLHSNIKEKLLEEKTKEQQLVIVPPQHLDMPHKCKRKSSRIEGDGLPPIMLALGHGRPVKHHKH